ncbi:hypothetical protein Tco_0026881 [Tanacetum coccineum]
MPIEFVVFTNHTTYPESQELPSLFLKSCFNGNKHLYVTSNRRYRFKAKLVGDDTFYVTGYDNDGLECGGYNVVRKCLGRIVTRVWPYQDYPQVGSERPLMRGWNTFAYGQIDSIKNLLDRFSSSKPLSPPIPKYQISVCLLFSKPDVRNGMVKSESVQLLSADYTV